MSILKYKNASGQWEKVGIPNTSDIEHLIDEKLSTFNSVPFTISATAPSNTSIFWIDSSNGNALKFYNGSAWVAVGAIWG